MYMFLMAVANENVHFPFLCMYISSISLQPVSKVHFSSKNVHSMNPKVHSEMEYTFQASKYIFEGSEWLSLTKKGAKLANVHFPLS